MLSSLPRQPATRPPGTGAILVSPVLRVPRSEASVRAASALADRVRPARRARHVGRLAALGRHQAQGEAASLATLASRTPQPLGRSHAAAPARIPVRLRAASGTVLQAR